jgi:SAM-dependent methyltransferase
MDHTHSHADADTSQLADLLDLDAEALPSYLAEVSEWVRELAPARPIRRILDLGAGTGVGSVALAQGFPDADVIAVDGSPEMLSRLNHKATELGLAARIGTVEADLDVTWPAIEPVDIVWASMSLHHLADPDRVLEQVFTSLRPGGLVVALEMTAPLHFLPDDIGTGRPGLEERCHAALAQERAAALPHLGADWGPRLERAGFTSVVGRTFEIDVKPAGSGAAGRHARGFFQRMRPAVESRLDPADRAVLDSLLDSAGPDSLLHRTDLHLHGTRPAWAAHRR